MSTVRVNSVLNVAGDDNPTVVAATAQSAAGSVIDFTGLPAWIKRIQVLFEGVSLSGTDNILIQLGDSGGFETSGYDATSVITNGAAGGGNTGAITAGFVIRGALASNVVDGAILTLTNLTGNVWVGGLSGKGTTSGAFAFAGGGDKTLSDTLTQVRITRSGSNTFDSGQIGLFYE